MSNTSAKSQPKSISEAQPETASLASVSRLTTVMSSPVSVRARSRNSSRVGGEPAGLGGDQPGAHHPVPPDLGRAHLQRLDRALDGGLRQPAARGHALAQADDARERVDDLEAAPRRARHQQPAVVGAEIERGIGGFGSGGPRRRPFGSGAVDGSGLDGRSARGGSRNGVGRTWPVALPATVFGGAQLGCAVLVLATLHSLSPAPGFSPAGPLGVILVELGVHSISSRPRVKERRADCDPAIGAEASGAQLAAEGLAESVSRKAHEVGGLLRRRAAAAAPGARRRRRAGAPRRPRSSGARRPASVAGCRCACRARSAATLRSDGTRNSPQLRC